MKLINQSKKCRVRKNPILDRRKKMDKALMSLKEVCEYTGLGETKVREILKNPASKFTLRVGNRLYVNKELFDEHLKKCAKYQIPL